jgi:hypothetical protein
MFNSLARFDKSGSQRSEEMFTSDSKQEPGESESKSERGDWSLGCRHCRTVQEGMVQRCAEEQRDGRYVMESH